ncbi:site-specific DNA-methyltransferase [Micromonospora sp. WMMD1082]|uniref:DNA-methyltransferase n=1 Tax=Micromonospora sp. WMMD1082 TaxID=3016104 RepID=UPI002417C26F|nr:site-specific DNA-methyltransferase [Micromonospora sp. WMMD1082]MDG4795071.1 site-specific DNA-methyltransferase [Micromonospora sp. WMMD1082]
MTEHLDDPLSGYEYRRAGPVALYLGDATRVLSAMPDASVHAVVTSPPYWGLRDYGTGRWTGGNPGCPHRIPKAARVDGAVCPPCGAGWSDPQYGLEPTVHDYVARLVAVFDQIRRVLDPAGTCWLNLGDGYSSAAGGAPASGRRQADGARATRPRAQDLVAPKNLLGVPWRVAFALQSSGWFLRNAVIWAKPNPMPESVRDRLSSTYETLFLLTRSPQYHFDLDPIRLPLKQPEAADGSRVFGGARKGTAGGINATARRRGGRYGGKHTADTSVAPGAGRGNLVPLGRAHTAAHPRGRNPGDVWRIATRPYRGAHVAPFPVDLPLRAVAAGCPPAGLVLDPFCGAGTTGLAALQLGRRFAGIDISAPFLDETLTRLTPHLPNPGPVAR